MAYSGGFFDTAPQGDNPRKYGALSILGRIGQNITAPMLAAYGNDSGFKALQLQQQQDQADLEFQKYLSDKKNKAGELGSRARGFILLVRQVLSGIRDQPDLAVV